MDGQDVSQLGVTGTMWGWFALFARLGRVDGQRIPLLRQIIRTNKKDRSEATLKADTLRWVKHHFG